MDVESTTWYYAFDNNGNLREMTPNGSNPADGAIQYTYNTANQLVKTEFHNGSAYAKIAEASYDGEGNRTRLVTWASSVPLTTTYTFQLVEWVQVLQAKTGASTTTYLYGVNPIGEFGTQSVYYLLDGAGSIRQLADLKGFVVLSRWYEPFGQILTQKGTAVATYGYMGTQLDRVTGLLYRNGRYYDPVTGRYLTPGGGANPYLPLQISGSLLGPLAILSAMAQRNRKRRKWVQVLAVALVLLAAGGMLAGCGGDTGPQPPTKTPEETPAKPSPKPGKAAPSSTPKPPTARPLPSPTTDRCKGYSEPEPVPPPDKAWESMDEYYKAQKDYAIALTNSYTPDEQMLARMIWNEQRKQGYDAMVAAAWSVINRMRDKTYFGHVNTIQAVLEDTQCSSSDTSGQCKQYHGYPGVDPLPIIAEMGSGPGFREDRNQPNDRELWFMALDAARRVINGCEQDKTNGYLWFGNGADVLQRMKDRKANVKGFDYLQIEGTNLYFSNLPYL